MTLIFRYLRLRNGSGVADGSGHDNFTINGGHDIVVDHVSMSWSTDENVLLYGKTANTPIRKVTIQHSIMAEGLAGHSNSMIVGGRDDTGNPDNRSEELRQVNGTDPGRSHVAKLPTTKEPTVLKQDP